ncbi:MAG TPA: long-chain fatty acid--CoA ligase, partial [Acidimicrobiales bacterium]
MSIAQAWRERVDANPDRIAIRYFDGSLTAAEVDAHAQALAVDLRERGVRHGDRIGIHLQNVPHYPIVLLALWHLGAVGVPLNPMYQGAELRRLVDDSGATGIVAAPGEEALREALAGSTVRWIITASANDFQTRRAVAEPSPSPDGDVAAILAARAGERTTPATVGPDETAFITYTSGTTGPPKGALNTHRNFLHAVANYAEWVALEPGDVSFAIAPLFHITGLSLNAGIALLNDATLSLAGRFEPEAVLEAFREHGVTTTIGSITAFNALLRVPTAGAEHLRTIRLLYSGGAPIPPATIESFRSRFGHYLHNIWGMTETTGGGVAVPAGAAAPVHEP